MRLLNANSRNNHYHGGMDVKCTAAKIIIIIVIIIIIIIIIIPAQAKQFSDDIGTGFGLEKCAKANCKRGKLASTGNIVINDDTEVQELDQEDVYKYLGVDESDGIQHSKMKEKIRKEYNRRVRLVLRTELNGRNKVEAINRLAVPVIQFWHL